MKTSRVKTPIIPRNRKDPTQSYKSLNKTYRNIENRYYNIKLKFKNLFAQRLNGQERESNQCYIFREGTIYQANSNYIYDISPVELDSLLELMSNIIDEFLLEGGRNEFWMLSTIEREYQRGTHSAFTNLAHQSTYYAEQTVFTELLTKPAYKNQIKQAFSLTFSDWKSLAESTKADLNHVLVNAIARGINPRETGKIISKRLNVSMSKACALAQTEQIGALRQSQWNETQWASERLGLKTALLHISAKLLTSRLTHVYWDGRIRTPEEVKDWYEESGNRFNCHCSQIPILLNEKNQPYNETAIARLCEEREKWLQQRKLNE